MKKSLILSALVFIVLICFSFISYADTPIYTVNLDSSSQSVFNDIKAGDKFEGVLILKLITQKEVKFQVNFSTSFGKVVALGGGGSVLDMKTWFNFPDGDIFTLDGTEEGEQVLLVPYEITIPDSIMPADYSGILSIGIVDETKFKNNEGAGVVFSTAIGIPFKFSVAGERIPKLVFEDFWFLDLVEKYSEKKINYDLILGYKFINLGNAALMLDSDVKISSITGEEIFSENVELGKIYPGDKESKLSTFRNIGKIYGWININSDIYYTLFDLEGNPIGDRVKLAHAFLRVYSIPWVELIIIFVLFVALFLYLFYRFYKRKALRAKSKIYIAKKTDNFQSICKKFSVEPKKLIFVNKLKAPYFIEEGKKLYIPKTK
ncbi:hypothetical protein GF354_03310 [Candidatus Peregrinibacteria bacterium]|nr:hypothetical protein [Candidatus Peregrinibacteria bacterium]